MLDDGTAWVGRWLGKGACGCRTRRSSCNGVPGATRVGYRNIGHSPARSRGVGLDAAQFWPSESSRRFRSALFLCARSLPFGAAHGGNEGRRPLFSVSMDAWAKDIYPCFLLVQMPKRQSHSRNLQGPFVVRPEKTPIRGNWGSPRCVHTMRLHGAGRIGLRAEGAARRWRGKRIGPSTKGCLKRDVEA